jgi:predicted dienelactone hydrolase
VVVFGHGIQSMPSAYGDLLRAWAPAGFVVAAPVFPLTGVDVQPVHLDVLNQPADISFVLTQVLALHTTAGDVLEGQPLGAVRPRQRPHRPGDGLSDPKRADLVDDQLGG